MSALVYESESHIMDSPSIWTWWFIYWFTHNFHLSN